MGFANFYYRLHWWPAVEAESIGMHTIGLALHTEDEGSWFGRVNITAGVNNFGVPTLLFGAEVELIWALVLLMNLES
jgi:hypothetical protein